MSRTFRSAYSGWLLVGVPKRGIAPKNNSMFQVSPWGFTCIQWTGTNLRVCARDVSDQPQATQVDARRGLTVAADRENVLHPGRVDNSADCRRGGDEPHRSLSHFSSPPGHQERPQTRAIHERDAGQIEQQPRAISAHDVQQDLLKRLLVFEVEVTADLHEGAEIGPADAY